MKRNRIVWLILTVLLAALISTAAAELNVDSPEDGTLAIFYVASSDDAATIATAQYAAQAIVSRWPNKSLFISRTKTNYPKGYNNLDLAIKNNIFKNANHTGNEKIDAQIQTLQDTISDVWVIVPNNAAESIFQNQDLYNQLAAILNDGQSRAHFIFIGEGKEITEYSSALFFSGLPIDWIQIKRTFAENERNTGEKEWMHTGDYLMASLYGKPLDLPLRTEEGQWSFDLPEASHVFVLAKGKGIRADSSVTVRDTAGNPVSMGRYYVEKRNNDSAAYTGALSENTLNSGTYTISGELGQDPSLKVYWYPDFNEIQPELSLDDTWQLGNNLITVKMKKTLSEASQYTVQINFGVDRENFSLVYQPESESWSQEYPVKPEDAKDWTLAPIVSLFMKDGNLAWTWKGEAVTKTVETGKVTVLNTEPQEHTLYYWENRVPGFSGEWKQYFGYNELEQTEKGIILSDEAKEAGWTTETDESGFSVSWKPSADSSQEKPEPESFSLTISYGDKQQEITIRLSDAKSLFENAVSFDPGATKAKVGEKYTVKARISDIDETWKDVQQQLQISGMVADLPDPGNLKFDLMLKKAPEGNPENGEQPEVSISEPFIKNENTGEREAEITVSLDPKWQGGAYQLTGAVISTGEQEIIRKAMDEQEIQIQNNQPAAKGSNEYHTELLIDDVFKEGKLDLLSKVFGDQPLIELFEDEETGVQSVDVSIPAADGLVMDEKTYVEGETITFAVTGSEIPSIQATAPGKYTIRLTATDGVNQSEPLELNIKIDSRFTRLLTYTGIGVGAAVVLAAVILIILQKRKPAFGDVQIRCVCADKVSSDNGNEMLQKSRIIPMRRYQKKGVPMDTLMVLGMQPEVPASVLDILKDITVYPYRYEEIRLVFGKNAMAKIGRQTSQEKIPQGNVIRFRIENTYFQIENYR